MKSTESNTSTSTLPLVALIGPTNAGKSTLFNRLTGSWQAVTAKEESTTRDRVYGEVSWQGREFSVVDTGGLVDDKSELYQQIKSQMLQAVEEADLILFIYDARTGITPTDRQFLDSLRGKKELFLVANKVDTDKIENTTEEPSYLGFPVYKIAASTGRGVGDLLEDITKHYPHAVEPSSSTPIIALIGRPNVGKSTLLNKLTDTERAVVSPIAGTTRDVVTEKLQIAGKEFLVADTAGIRRRGKIEVGVENFSVKRALEAIKAAKMIIVLVDASIGTSRGDLHLIYYANELKKPVLVVFNKIDLVDDRSKVPFHHHIAKFDRILVSAQTGEGLDQISRWVIDELPK
ncbi:ribosome biogenesis GTPase Der [Candidatus Berkelbacteria bacterium RIFCSPLOWO2_01_FULL_50_28]|uniref:GTPase Der n=1 Tax=Candidatus Berkelbacteria bacterium RIFCSPLOWO2_01_FULL_50_28 TaxID=1797471 RepID=A0A1F5EC49_9BACT|nr:MAG: ribosome biogenesis GTPase Der [Candidatus Berkelbacteria bacterium RIFCSPHIGHO2_01_FULL_50_36]OGD62673.1 MAG: ribosome biogenesis GTPase Der [Candidatus Berkelbacteria bacterium RIFCSPHIGHO2_12_FULL_50_11]OGD64982.1 MAG: ribosome biogenesis GTPase Der [Candidatus Berkelbacteria bacterium RIFCSPLOWO2_01_FULL_50_28]